MSNTPNRISYLNSADKNSPVQQLSNQFSISSLLTPPNIKRPSNTSLSNQAKIQHVDSTSSSYHLCSTCGGNNHKTKANRLCPAYVNKDIN